MADWIRKNQPIITFALAIGTFIYTIITYFILRVSARQLRTMVQPALTLRGREPLLKLGSLRFDNIGNGAALNIVTRIAVHSGSGLSRFPKFDTETTRLPSAVPAGGEFGISSLHTAVESFQDSYGQVMYKLLHEYEVFVYYESIATAKYVTHLSIGIGGSIDSSYVGKRSLIHLALLRAGIIWRYYRQRIPIWRKLRRQRG